MSSRPPDGFVGAHRESLIDQDGDPAAVHPVDFQPDRHSAGMLKLMVVEGLKGLGRGFKTKDGGGKFGAFALHFVREPLVVYTPQIKLNVSGTKCGLGRKGDFQQGSGAGDALTGTQDDQPQIQAVTVNVSQAEGNRSGFQNFARKNLWDPAAVLLALEAQALDHLDGGDQVQRPRVVLHGAPGQLDREVRTG